MSFLSITTIQELNEKMVSDLSLLGKQFRARKAENMTISVDHNLVESYESP